MVTIKLFKEDTKISEISIFNRLNIVVGDSGSGKTYFIDRVTDAINMVEPWRIISDKEVITIRDIQTLKLVLNSIKDNIIIIDEDITSLILTDGTLLSKLSSSKNYIIMLDRSLEARLNVNIKAVFHTKQIGGKVEFISEYKANKAMNINFKEFKWIISEDTKSGRVFWSNILGKLKFIDSVNPGDGGLLETIKNILKNNVDGKILVALDYDKGSIALRNILKSDIDMTRISFIEMESLEEVICNSDFILNYKPDMIDKVLNYKKYITCHYRSTGKYFSDLLRVNITQYNKNYTSNKDKFIPFYNKGMEKFKECFLEDCCSIQKDDCFMYYDGDKKKAMLANKFEIYRELI